MTGLATPSFPSWRGRSSRRPWISPTQMVPPRKPWLEIYLAIIGVMILAYAILLGVSWMN